VERLTAEVNELKKRYNELKHVSKVRQKDLTTRNDELRDLERDSGARTSSDNPLARVSVEIVAMSYAVG
jgi:cell division protein FtsX